MASTAVDIVSITTGRESILIGPAAAFGSGTRGLVLRDRPRIQGILVDFVSRPGSVDMIRPHMRRWGLKNAHSLLNEREWIRETLLRAISSGHLLISVAPDVTRGFSVPHSAIVRKTTSAAKAQALQTQPHLPVDLEDRLVIVMQMVPDYMSGSTKAAFVQTIEDIGIGMIVGGLIAWIGAHFIPGINLAVLAFDLFFLGSDLIKACEKIASTLEDIRKARNRKDLEPAAKAIAAALAVLIVAGIFNRILRAKNVTKAASKKTRHAIDEKPNMGGDPKVKREARKPAPGPEEPPPYVPPKERRKQRLEQERADKIAREQKRVAEARARQHKMLDDDKGFNISPNSWDKHKTIGRNGTYVTDQKEMDKVLSKLEMNRDGDLIMSKADAERLELDMGLQRGSLQEGFKVREVTGLSQKGARSPTEGNRDFLGAGQHLPGGAPEMVVDSIPTTDTDTVKTYMKVIVR